MALLHPSNAGVPPTIDDLCAKLSAYCKAHHAAEVLQGLLDECNAANDGVFPIRDLPPEIMNIIMAHLPLASLLKLHQVCKAWAQSPFETPAAKFQFFSVKTSGGTLPSKRLCHSGGLYKDALYIVCGDSPAKRTSSIGELQHDIQRFDFVTKQWKDLQASGVPSVTEHCNVVYKDALYIYGGISPDFSRTNDLYRYDFNSNTCARVSVNGDYVPKNGSCHSAVVYKDKLYVFGGWDPNRTGERNDLDAFDFATKTWTAVEQTGDIPSFRRAHKSVVWKDALWTFGGWCKDAPLNDLHRFDFHTHVWKKIHTKGEVPTGRSRFTMAVRDNVLYVLGGWDGTSFLDHLYMLNLTFLEWRRSPASFPRPSGQHVMEMYHNLMLVWGGNDGKLAQNDFYGCFI